MIRSLTIQNFKSVKSLKLNCKRVNLFIGEPNTGKSNLLEALGLLALPFTNDIKLLVRLEDLSNLFFENDITKTIKIQAGKLKCSIDCEDTSPENVVFNFYNGNEKCEIVLPITGDKIVASKSTQDFGIHPYFFKSIGKFDRKSHGFLSPPSGDNLYTLLQSNRNTRKLISDIIQEKGFKLLFRTATSEIEISKERDEVITAYPFVLISDTLQRIIFYVTAIETNKKATLIFEDPESNVFPYYTKYLAEKIAFDEANQYFMTTHNPYFLQSIVEKTSPDDLSINLVRMDNYQTIVSEIGIGGLEEILNLSSDIFLNFDKLLEA